MGCSEGTNADLEKVEVDKKQKEDKKSEEDNKDNKEKEKEEEKKNEDEMYMYTGINEKDFSLCKKLAASKEYDKDTILLYKCLIDIHEEKITYHEYFVVKTLKKEGLSYENKNFEFNSPCVLLGLTPDLDLKISKEVITKEISCGSENLKDMRPLILPVIKLKLYKIQKRHLHFIVLFQQFKEIIKQE